MFYLTYRPKSIAELDNSTVKETLANVLKSANLPHAYLFIGQKGMGKTSTARIFAKAVNCLNNRFADNGDSVEPCNQCANCSAIDMGQSPDVIEQDAASNRGIDEIRNLIKEAAFAPMTTRYRVFIIDEAHMITNDAFNALLKTLEEPPEKVLFILATTNEEKVPRTIVSRCFRVNFGRAKRADIIAMLTRILAVEKKKLPADVLEFIADSSEHSFRDATKMLEELTIQGKITLEDAQKHFGIRSKHSFFQTLETGTVAEALKWLHQFEESGGSSRLFIEDLLRTLQLMLLRKSGVPAEDAPDTKLSVREIAHFMKLLTEAYGTVRNAPIESIPLEIAVVEFYNERKQ
jgi:DNA polymerase-3 subunit gamma/tau